MNGCIVACKASKDAHGTTYHISEDKTGRTAGGQKLSGSAAVDVWWARKFKDRRDETLLIRQESNPNKADVIELTLGQAYDLHHALGVAILRA